MQGKGTKTILRGRAYIWQFWRSSLLDGDNRRVTESIIIILKNNAIPLMRGRNHLLLYSISYGFSFTIIKWLQQMRVADFSLPTRFPKIPFHLSPSPLCLKSCTSSTQQNQDCSNSNMVTVTVHDALNWCSHITATVRIKETDRGLWSKTVLENIKWNSGLKVLELPHM